jgi:hypothetical protein
VLEDMAAGYTCAQQLQRESDVIGLGRRLSRHPSILRRTKYLIMFCCEGFIPHLHHSNHIRARSSDLHFLLHTSFLASFIIILRLP